MSRNLEKPTILKKIDSLTAYIGNKILLTCTALGYPEPEISWSLFQNQIPTNILQFPNIEENHNGSLIINNFQYYNIGDYQCTAKNIIGYDMMNIKLTLKGNHYFLSRK